MVAGFVALQQASGTTIGWDVVAVAVTVVQVLYGVVSESPTCPQLE